MLLPPSQRIAGSSILEICTKESYRLLPQRSRKKIPDRSRFKGSFTPARQKPTPSRRPHAGHMLCPRPVVLTTKVSQAVASFMSYMLPVFQGCGVMESKSNPNLSAKVDLASGTKSQRSVSSKSANLQSISISKSQKKTFDPTHDTHAFLTSPIVPSCLDMSEIIAFTFQTLSGLLPTAETPGTMGR